MVAIYYKLVLARAGAAMAEDEIAKVIDDAFVSGALVSAWEWLKKKLIEQQMAWKQQVAPENVGCHHRNRSGEGVGAIESHYHGWEICVQGWSWTKAADAVAVECINDETSLQHNQNAVALSDGCFPPLGHMSLLSISASHTNAFLRSVKAGSISACPNFADKRGRLNLDDVCSNRPEMRDAVMRGLTWYVISHAAVTKYPRLIDLVQKSMNTRAHESSSETEVMLGMAAQAKWVDQPDWKAIQASAAFSNPPCTAWLNELATFVREHGGGGLVLEDLNYFSRAMVSMKGQKSAGSKKMMGSEFWAKVNTLKWSTKVKKPWLVNAVVKANMASPPHKVVDGFCKLVEPRHISMLMSKENVKAVDQAESLMTDARAVLDKLQIAKAQHAIVLGKLDARCVWFIMKLGKAGEDRTFDSIAAIGQVPAFCMHVDPVDHHVVVVLNFNVGSI